MSDPTQVPDSEHTDGHFGSAHVLNEIQRIRQMFADDNPTFRSAILEALPGPPLHPNCRCTVEPLGDQSFADALRREADRHAPKSMIAYAEKSVAAGQFPTRGPIG